MITIENEYLLVEINPRGAEILRLYHKKNGIEYMWNGGQPWPKTSPVLFPVVGLLKDETYYMNGKEFHLGRHGFGRESNYTVSNHTPLTATFTLESSEETLDRYPFTFRFEVIHELDNDSVKVTYRVANVGHEVMYFSVGAHPAFNVPLVGGTQYNDYYLLFDEIENCGRWPLAGAGLLETAPAPFLENTNRLQLNKDLFANDAIVLKGLKSDSVQLLCDRSPHGLQYDFPGFPYLGIWAFKGADFVCIEPWCGVADSVNSSQQLPEKEGIVDLPPSGTFEREWKVRLF